MGGAQDIKTDVRIIAASNRDLEEQVKEGSFREDLFYRINVVQIRMPSLRERPEDIPAAGGAFLQEMHPAAVHGGSHNRRGIEVAMGHIISPAMYGSLRIWWRDVSLSGTKPLRKSFSPRPVYAIPPVHAFKENCELFPPEGMNLEAYLDGS